MFTKSLESSTLLHSLTPVIIPLYKFKGQPMPTLRLVCGDPKLFTLERILVTLDKQICRQEAGKLKELVRVRMPVLAIEIELPKDFK